ncbi:uncharacterized protein LOC132272712 [Cornus florida]|uniref:uncharacterized protein LOC132272712 n=1 Tax=Cornus florida TaxID=4283 RepID=UPI00289846F3|nr:uncharacterized protein LOC132272712 [Cornus florida]
MALIANKAYLGHRTKRRKTSDSLPDWPGLPIDLWESILTRLSVVDLLGATTVCHSWCSLAKARISSLESPLFDQPLVLLPGTDQDNKIRRCLYNFAEKKAYKQLKKIPEDLVNCKGSSHGWLIFLDPKAIPYIFSPFLEVLIKLPPFRVSGEVCKTSIDSFFVRDIKKGVLSSAPIHCDNYWVAVIYGSVEIWDFNNSLPKKKMEIQPIFPEKKWKFEKSLGDNLYTIQSYIVESKGDLLLILSQKKWVELASLGDDQVLFLGPNQSVSHSAKSFPYCKGNSIYFTDEYYCDHLGENDIYGHDTGRFDMENQSIELINEDKDDWQKIDPAPIWVVPNPC